MMKPLPSLSYGVYKEQRIMKAILMAVLALIFIATTGRAGEIYGSISEGNKPVPAGVIVQVRVADKIYTTETDKFGSYRILVREKGKGTLTITYDVESATLGISSYEKSTRYDWVLETKDGKLAIRRK